MDNKINLSQLTDLFCNVSNLGKGVSTTFVKNFFETIINEVMSGGQVRIKGFGLFKQIIISDRESVDVNTGERIVIHGHQKVSFTPDPELKEFINKPFAGFETVIIDATDTPSVPAQAEKKSAVRKKAVATGNKEDEPVVSNAATIADTNFAATADAAEFQTTDPIVVQHEFQQVVTTENPVNVVEVKRIMRGLRALLIAIIALLAALIVSYCIWPLNLMLHMRKSMESVENVVPVNVSQNNGIANASSAENASDENTADVQNTTDKVAAQVAEDTSNGADNKPNVRASQKTNAQTKSQQKQAEMPIAQNQQEKASSQTNSSTQKSEFTLTEADNLKSLDQFTIKDTTSYRMTNVIITTHVLKSGETLTKVSEKYYGTKKLWPYIAAYNNITDVNSASVGTRLKIPILVNR